MVASPEEFSGLTDGGLLRSSPAARPSRAESYPAVPTLQELGWDIDIGEHEGLGRPRGDARCGGRLFA